MNDASPHPDDAPQGASGDLAALQEQAIDALIGEVLQNNSPPDLTATILSQLNHAPSASDSSASEPSAGDSSIRIAASPSPARGRSGKRSYFVFAAALGAIAASLALIVFLAGPAQPNPIAEGTSRVDNESMAKVDNDIASQDRTSENTDTNRSPQLADHDAPLRADSESAPDKGGDDRRDNSVARGVPMIVSSDNPSPNRTLVDDLQGQSPNPNPSHRIEPIQQVAATLNQKWQGYWKAAGVTPTEEASADVVTRRLAETLGIQLSSAAVGDPRKLQAELVSHSASQKVAQRWLDQITGGGLGKLKNDQLRSLVDQAAKAFRSEQPLDQELVAWISGNSPQASSFYSAASSRGHDAMVLRLASVTMGVDLRCTKCHDALIEGNGRQNSFWAFSSFLTQGVQRTRDGAWSVVSRDQFSSQPSFYELPDGRQRFVQAAVDPAWVSQRPADDVAAWATNLKRSPELARGVVDSIWQLVHGRPLQSHVIDTIAAPHHKLLDDVQNQLASDLIASDFDAARTLALIIASPPTHRAVPDALLPKNQLMASDQSIRNSMHAVDAFAAAQPLNRDLPLSRRLAVALKSVGASVKDLDGSELLANIGTSIASDAGSRKADAARDNSMSHSLDDVDFPSKASQLPVQWLSSIDSYQNRVQHLGYLAGQSQLPDAILQAADVLHEGQADDNLALHRVWWLIRP
ncbi:hypothetical protein [Planctomycetes bacterium K23_9]|uniref:DUF1549 domain-containing protein n=1 Tax=Stieleria marina TaxID=1930275 RepID=A0A517NPY7_9BACT|nr:hypothetical protein K239x_11220 [Planctomycetes bacterium K23_9]